MQNFSLDIKQAPVELQAGLAAVMADFPQRFGAGVALAFVADPSLKGLQVSQDGQGLKVAYGRTVDAFRALGRLLGMEAPAPFAETAYFDTLGVMFDCSRNAVLNLDGAKNLFRRCALMGINAIMLYTEDTYEVPGEPYFGYLRGRYTHEELQELDQYAATVGIEMIPCIQTLGHLEQILQWPAYQPLQDVPGVLIAEDERTYALIEKLIAAAGSPVRSKRIHIGMDEAHGVGTGRYKEMHGEKPPFDVLNAHLDRVLRICKAHDLRPMIWSDMYFRLGSKTGDYYDKETVIPQWAIDRIPKGVDLVYWDYYHADVDFYLDWIDRHRALGSEPVFAGGVWTWGRFWAALPYAFTMIDASMTACRQKGIHDAFTTVWGDDGNECDVFSSLPALQLFAEYGYAEQVDMAQVARNFHGATGADFADYVNTSKLDYFATTHNGTESFSNHSKWLLYADPFYSLADPLVADYDLKTYYGTLADALDAATAKGGLDSRLRFPALIARALSLKTHLRRNLREAYLAGDTQKLQAIANGDLAQLRKTVDELWKCHRAMWLATYKPFGLEVMELRFGGLRTRLESLADRLDAYLAGEIAEIPELKEEILRPVDGKIEELWMPFRRVTTPSCIK
jgi:hypothetical protein